MGTVEKNPNVDSAAGLRIHFPNIRPHPLYYPSPEKVFLPALLQQKHEKGKSHIYKDNPRQTKRQICFQISDMEKNGFAVIATKEEVRLLHHLQILKQPQLLLFTFGACLFFPQHMRLKEIMDNKNYTEIFEDEKELLWKLRSVVRDHYPESLSKLLLITKWNKREDVVQMVALLRHWPDLPAIHALELLDYSFPDPAVRAFTIRCLRKLRCAHISV